MYQIITVAFSLIFLASSVCSAADDEYAGKWKAVFVSAISKPSKPGDTPVSISIQDDITLTIADGNFQIANSGVSSKVTVKLHERKSDDTYRQINVTISEASFKGIIMKKGDSLSLCLIQHSDKYPTKFELSQNDE